MNAPATAGDLTDTSIDPAPTPGLLSPPPSRRTSLNGPRERKVSKPVDRIIAPPAGWSTMSGVGRKRLPWLGGGHQPGGHHAAGMRETKQDAGERSLGSIHPPLGATPSSPERAVLPKNDTTSQDKRASVISLHDDPALRAVGSEPSLRERVTDRRLKTFSLTSQPRPGVKIPVSKKQAKHALGVVNETSRSANYTPSEYSATPSSEIGTMPSELPKKDPASYERLVERDTPRRPSSLEPVLVADKWLQSQLDLPLNPPPEQPAIEDGAQPAPKVKATSVEERRRTSSIHPSSMPLPQKQQTLHQLPPHLMGSGSSSQSTPSHLLLSTDPSSPDLSPRASTKISPETHHLRRPLAPPAIPVRSARRESKHMNRAVNGLERLMDDAIRTAKDAARSDRHDEASKIIDDATIALRKASTVHGTMMKPLVLSYRSGVSTDTDASFTTVSDELSPYQSREGSADTSPTVYTQRTVPSQQPVIVERYSEGGRVPASETVAIRKVVGQRSLDEDSISHTPPRLYQQPSADSIVRDFAYAELPDGDAVASGAPSAALAVGAAADYYGDMGQSILDQPGIRRSIGANYPEFNKPLPTLPPNTQQPERDTFGRRHRYGHKSKKMDGGGLRELEAVPANAVPTHRRQSSSFIQGPADDEPRKQKHEHHPHIAEFFETSYYRQPPRNEKSTDQHGRKISTVTDTRYDEDPSTQRKTAKLARNHISLREGQGFSLGRYHRRQPIAREWKTLRKRITATIACFNTVFIGLIAGIYAGEVPGIQYQLADLSHKVILGNVLLFVGLGLTTLIFWPLPLLHGRKPYTLMAFALMLPLQFPQALSVSSFRDPSKPLYRCGLLVPRILTGMAMGFANINQLPTLFDLFGASLMHENPHQEIVVYDDVRRQGGGVGIWLGIWSWCFVGSLSIGFCVGACIISTLDPSWGFYIVVIMLAFFLLVNVIAPETRRAPYRRSISHFFDEGEKVQRRVARGEVKLHISNDGPKWWFEEVWAGLILTKRMVLQSGCFVLMVYIGWIYAQVMLVILLLGALLSRDYQWESQYVGLAVLALAVGALLAMPLAKASLFSRARTKPSRTDSMTMRTQRLTWTSHLMRRCIFTLALPFAGLAYTLSSSGKSVNWTAPVIFSGLVGFLSNLAIAECIGLIMENFDTCDLQPGVNQKHRLQSMAETTRRRRTNYSSFPRICAGFFAAQSLGFFLAAAATGVSGDVTRALGAQTSTAIVAGILLVITVLLSVVLWRHHQIQVVPNSPFGADAKKGSIVWGPGAEDPEWKAVIIGNPSGKLRRMNLFELGNLSRWTEIRKLNKLIHN